MSRAPVWLRVALDPWVVAPPHRAVQSMDDASQAAWDALREHADEVYRELRSDETANEYVARHQSVPGRMTFTVLERGAK